MLKNMIKEEYVTSIVKVEVEYLFLNGGYIFLVEDQMKYPLHAWSYYKHTSYRFILNVITL